MSAATPGARQMPLDLGLARRRAMGRAEFLVSEANETALAMLDDWRGWPNARLALIGPEGAGKTHLAHVWMSESGAERVDAAALTEADAPGLAARGAVAVEDADRLADDAPDQMAVERALFHLLNLAAAEGCAVLLTGRTAPSRWAINTPDLASRLQAVAVARIDPPDDALLAAILAKQFRDRQLRVSEALIKYLLPRMERSFKAAGEIAERLDRAALAAGKPVSRTLAAEALGWSDSRESVARGE